MGNYFQLTQTVLRSADARCDRGAVIAVISAAGGEGVSHVVRLLGMELARHSFKRILLADADGIRKQSMDVGISTTLSCERTQLNNLWMLPREETASIEGDSENAELQADAWSRDPQSRVESVAALQRHFDCILVDCSSLATSPHAVTLAPLVDGIVIVVEAGRTNREQILYSKRIVEEAKGNLLGFVLNKRRFPVPNWLYKRL